MDKLVARIVANWPLELSTNISFTVALSGGVDSVVLLHIMNEIVSVIQTRHVIHNTLPAISAEALTHTYLDAIHINHNISPNALEWSNFCQDLCQSLSIKLKTCNVQISKPGGESLENNARKMRYAEFFEHETNVIILAHHKMDQVETTLSQIFRGSNLHNIAAMRTITQKQNKIFWRPLLDFTKTDLEEYAKRHSLQYITDESNDDCQYLRNFVRHDILPNLIRWDRDILAKILNINEQIQNNVALIDEVATADLKEVIIAKAEEYHTDKTAVLNITALIPSTETIVIDLAKFRQLSILRQYNVLSHFILKHNLPLPSSKQIQELTRQLNTCQIDKSPSLVLDQHHAIIRHKNSIFIRNMQI